MGLVDCMLEEYKEDILNTRNATSDKDEKMLLSVLHDELSMFKYILIAEEQNYSIEYFEKLKDNQGVFVYVYSKNRKMFCKTFGYTADIVSATPYTIEEAIHRLKNDNDDDNLKIVRL